MNPVAVAVTGHRPNKLGGYGESPTKDAVVAILRQELHQQIELHEITAISGMALGVDQWFAQEALSLGIPLTAAVPFEGQESRWPLASQRVYRSLLNRATEVIVISPGGYAGWKMQARNAWMVDNCNLLIAIWDGTAGGTANCVRYATGKVEIHCHHPIRA